MTWPSPFPYPSIDGVVIFWYASVSAIRKYYLLKKRFNVICSVAVKRGYRLRALLSPGILLYTELYHGLRLYKDILCGQGKSQTWHQETST